MTVVGLWHAGTRVRCTLWSQVLGAGVSLMCITTMVKEAGSLCQTMRQSGWISMLSSERQ